MTDALFALVPVWGAWLVAAGTYLSCLALPIPSSFLMLAGGAFAAAGDLSLLSVSFGAWAGAVLGDQSGYALGRTGGAPLLRRIDRGPRRAQVLAQARGFLRARGGMAVFLSRWLFSPLGPYVNFLSGAGGLGWRRFTLGSVSGEAVWVLVYVSLGWAFSAQIETVAELAGNAVGLLAALAVVGVTGRMLWHRRAQSARIQT